MRKSLLLGLTAALAFSVGAVAAQDNDLSSVDPTGQTVVYWHQFSNAQQAAMDALIEKFNSTNEYGITIQATAQGNYNAVRELMNAAIISGETPNLVAGYANDAASYQADNVVIDLNTYLNDPTYGLNADQMADFNTSLLGFDTVDGELLAWPHQLSAQFMVVNTSLLESLGLEMPTTLEEFSNVACAVSESTGPNGEDRQGYPITTDASALESWIASQGGTIWDGEAYQFVGNEAITTSLQFYKDMYDQGCGYIPAERFAEQTDFSLSINPFFVTSSAGFTFIIAGFSDAGNTDTWQVTTFPTNQDMPALQVFIPSIIMIQGTPEQQLASWLFLKFLAEPENAAMWSEGTGYFNPVPSTGDMMADDTFTAEGLAPYFQAANAFLNSGDVRLYNSPSPSHYGTVRTLLTEAIANVTSNGQTVEEALATLQAGADQAIADAQ